MVNGLESWMMALSRLVFRGSVLCLLLFGVGCSTFSGSGGGPVPIEKEPDYTAVPPPATKPQSSSRPTQPSASAAYQPLLDKAGRATASGDYAQALALLERAHRIDPDSAEIYLSMAKTHKASGDMAQSRATAERGLLYCRGSAECEALRAYAR
jgi:tetratricopeptide (TPR) repeat protein